MAELSTVLSNDFLSGASGGITFSTTVYDGSTGLEMRNQVWSVGRHAWTLTYAGKLSELQPVIDLFSEAKGMAKSFRFAPLGYVEGDFRFTMDAIPITYQASGDTDDYITTITVSVIQVLGE